MRLVGIQPDEADTVWPHVELLIARACKYNGDRYGIEDCLAEIKAGEKQLWIVTDDTIRAVVITGIMCFPRMKCCMIDICTGEGLDQWVHLLPIIEDWAKENGCAEMFFMARPGMQKKLKPFGYRATHIGLDKVL